jgi:mono/diheme cytochrome c family protein
MKLNAPGNFFLAMCSIVALAGCKPAADPNFRFNAVELLKQERTQLADGEHFADSYRTEIGNLLTALFGTPNDPHFPFLTKENSAPNVIDLKNLQMAAGPVSSDRQGNPRGLYREHCSHCHGITGDGAGPTALFLNPYPRDFRLGKFKFKSTALRRPPTDEDLVRIIRDGIPGTAMPSFRTLNAAEVEALVDYVKYLTIRGQLERRMLAELGTLDGESLVDLNLASLAARNATKDLEGREDLEDQLDTVVGQWLSEEILPRWMSPDQAVTNVPPAPKSIALNHAEHQLLVDQGRRLFSGKANCVQCHGETGLGDGQVENFDDWTNEWAKTSGINPYRPETYQAFIRAGAFPPRPIRPRNLRMPVFRGGNRPDDIYRRIANGIEGTPMPSSPGLTAAEIWALVAYSQSLPYEKNVER